MSTVLLALNVASYSFAYTVSRSSVELAFGPAGVSDTSNPSAFFIAPLDLLTLGGALIVGYVQDQFGSHVALHLTHAASSLVYAASLFAINSGMPEHAATAVAVAKFATVFQHTMQAATGAAVATELEGVVSNARAGGDRHKRLLRNIAKTVSTLAASYTVGALLGKLVPMYVLGSHDINAVLLTTAITASIAGSFFVPTSSSVSAETFNTLTRLQTLPSGAPFKAFIWASTSKVSYAALWASVVLLRFARHNIVDVARRIDIGGSFTFVEDIVGMRLPRPIDPALITLPTQLLLVPLLAAIFQRGPTLAIFALAAATVAQSAGLFYHPSQLLRVADYGVVLLGVAALLNTLPAALVASAVHPTRVGLAIAASGCIGDLAYDFAVPVVNAASQWLQRAGVPGLCRSEEQCRAAILLEMVLFACVLVLFGIKPLRFDGLLPKGR